ncbi:MAG: serine protease [Pyrinomonadaceae bacterium]
MKIPTRAAGLIYLNLCLLVAGACFAGAGAANGQTIQHIEQWRINDNVMNSLVTVLVASDGQSTPVGSGVVVRSDGLILTAYHLVKGAPSISIRLRSGETFDRAELVASDERRNVAVLRIPAANLTSLATYLLEEGVVGSSVLLLSNNAVAAAESGTGMLSSVALADEIPGAGTGYRILKFTSQYSDGQIGGMLIDSKGGPIGLLAPAPNAQSQNYAVPLTSLVGLTRSIGFIQSPPVTNTYSQTTPYPILQSSVAVPQRPVTPLSARGPGSVVIKSARPIDILTTAKTIFVTSYTENFEPDQLVNELSKKSEMADWGLSFVDDRDVADLVLTLDHVLFTWKFTFKLADQRSGVIVASGDVIIWDGNLGSPQMAKRVIEKLTKVYAQKPTVEPAKKSAVAPAAGKDQK